ncbi:hypothetical protein LINGRAHAP2_LOCUS11757, partial [Linum grandiflorum]
DWIIHVDAAVRTSTLTSGYESIGLVVRRGCGSLISTTGLVYRQFDDPLLLELLAIKQALYVAQLRHSEIENSCHLFRLLGNCATD